MYINKQINIEIQISTRTGLCVLVRGLMILWHEWAGEGGVGGHVWCQQEGERRGVGVWV